MKGKTAYKLLSLLIHKLHFLASNTHHNIWHEVYAFTKTIFDTTSENTFIIIMFSKEYRNLNEVS